MTCSRVVFTFTLIYTNSCIACFSSCWNMQHNFVVGASQAESCVWDNMGEVCWVHGTAERWGVHALTKENWPHWWTFRPLKMGVLQYTETSGFDYPMSRRYIPGEWIRREKENAVVWKRGDDIIKTDLWKWSGMVWNGYIWLRIGTSTALLCMVIGDSGPPK